jgi:hypothetical protein
VLLLNENNLIIYALENYLLKESANRTTFLADFGLITTFSKYFHKHIETCPELVYNRIMILFNLFEYDAVIIILKYILEDKYILLSKYICIKNV